VIVYVVGVYSYFVSHERIPLLMGTLKEYFILLHFKIVVVEMNGDYIFLCQTHEFVMQIDNDSIVNVMLVLFVDNIKVRGVFYLVKSWGLCFKGNLGLISF
jgi:hypothetical protein